MKKFFFLTAFAAISSAALLSGCQKDRTATVIYTDVPSPLTQMTFRESLPPETYSEYMETYTSETETSSGRHYFSMIGGNGIYADTKVTAPPADTVGGIDLLKRDTAVVTTIPFMETDVADETVTCVPISTDTDITETNESSEQTETSETTDTITIHTLARPQADTGISIKSTKVSADTSVTDKSATEMSDYEILNESNQSE